MKHLILIFLLLNCSFLLAQAGKVDTTFNAPFYTVYGTGNGFNSGNFVKEVCEQPNGKLIVVGGFEEYNGEPRYGIARLNADGSLDHTFDAGNAFQNTNLDVEFTSVVHQNDGRIITIKSYYYGAGTNSSIKRFNSDGSLDTIPVILGEIVDGVVYKSVIQPDGKLILCGNFSYQDTNQNFYYHLIRINTDGSLDQTFAGGAAFFNFMQYGEINDLKLDAQGRILIGGGFNGYNGVNSKGIIRLNSNGTIDNTFNLGIGLNNEVSSIAIQSDNKIILGGNFSSYQNIYAAGIIRLNPDATLDTGFHCLQAFTFVQDINFMPDSSIIFKGGNSNYPAFGPALIRLQNNGNLDTINFMFGYIDILQLKTLSSGNIVLVGQFDSFLGKYRGSIAEIDGDFNLVDSFGPKPGFNTEIQRTLVDPSGKIYVGKYLNNETEVNVYNDTFVKGLVRLEANGALDTTFHIADTLFVSVEVMARQLDGKVVVGGRTELLDGNVSSHRNVVRFNYDGSLDSTFIPYDFISWNLYELLIQTDGKLVLLGKFSVDNGSTLSNITRLNSDGTLDPTFNVGTGTDNGITAGVITNSGKLIIGGNFSNYNGVPVQRLVRINTDGSIDPSFAFNGNVNSEVKSIKQQSDGKVYLTAQSLSTNNNYSVSILRLNIDGSIDNSFTEVFSNGQINTLLPLPDGKLLVGGDILSVMGVNATGIARLNSNGTRDNSFYSTFIPYAPNVIVKSIALGLDGKIVIGGNFSKVTGKPANNITLLQNDLNTYFDVSFMNISNISCIGNGSATAFAYGGTPPYQYSWQNSNNPFDSLQVIANNGVYTCSVQDATGVISYSSLVIDGPTSLSEFDLKVNLSAGQFRTGFDNTIVLTALNDGCIPTNGQLICVIDSLVNFNSSNPAPTYQNNDTLIWEFTNLTYDSGYLLPVINCTVLTSAQIGDTVSIDLFITPLSGDADTLSNVRNYRFPVVNGYDPNIKSVYPIGKCEEAFVENGQKFTYTVQFQNTGNSEAINIVVKDSLDENLNVNTLHIIGNSHPVWVEIIHETVKFHFDSINLPDSSSNEIGSHGYVIFEINPISNFLTNNTIISNKAEIYFDYNPAIVTNTCSNTIFDGDLDQLNCNAENNLTDEGFNFINTVYVFPNPTSDWITIRTNTKYEEMVQLIITDLSGKVVLDLYKDLNNDSELNLEFLETGTYIFIVKGSVNHDNIQYLKIVKR